MGGRHRQTVHVGPGDGHRRDELRSGTLTIGQMCLADLLPDGDDDPLPSDHRAEAERNRDRDLYPDRDELRGGVKRLLVGVQYSYFIRRQVGLFVLHQIAQSLVGEIHVVAGIADRGGGDFCNRAVLLDLFVDVLNQHGERRIGSLVDLVVRNILHHRRARIAEDVIPGALLLDDLRGGCRVGLELGDLAVGQGAVEGEGGGDRADQDQHDQAHALLSVVGAVGEADGCAGEDQKSPDPPCRRLIRLGRAVQLGLSYDILFYWYGDRRENEADDG